MKYSLFFFLLGVFFISSNCEQKQHNVKIGDAIRFSQDFILAIKTEQPHQTYIDSLATIDLKDLKSQLNSPSRKLAFWINTYNSLVQAKISKNPKAFSDQKSFFNEKTEEIGGTKLSLNDIESGILRLKIINENQHFADEFHVEMVDPRIHFTLNCGATSCPPVAYYSPDELEEQLKLATESFVSQTSNFDKDANTLTVSQLFEWYAEDFGEYEGILALFRRLEIISENDTPKLVYTPYDWNLDVLNFE